MVYWDQAMTSRFIPYHLSLSEYEESQRLTRRWYWWPILVLRGTHHLILIYSGAVLAAAALLSQKYRELAYFEDSAAGLAAVLLLLWLVKWIGNRRRRGKVRSHNSLIESWAFSDDGLFYRSSRKLLKDPWTAFRKAIITSEIVVLKSARKRSAIRILPITSLQDAEREQLLATLRQNLGVDAISETSTRRSKFRPNIVRRS
jgi:hypothetical protein